MTRRQKFILDRLRSGDPIDLKRDWLDVMSLKRLGLVTLEKQDNGQLLIRVTP